MKLRNLSLVAAVGVLALLSTRLREAESSRQSEQGRSGVQVGQVHNGRRALQKGDRARSGLRNSPAVSGYCLHEPVHSGRRFAREHAVCERLPSRSSRRFCEREPKNTLAIESIASLHYNEAQGNQPLEQKLKKLDEAAQWYQRLAEADPKQDRLLQPWRYHLGEVVSASDGSAPRNGHEAGRSRSAQGQEGSRKSCGADGCRPSIKGIQNLEKALQIDPEYDEAMAYLNLLHPRARRPRSMSR